MNEDKMIEMLKEVPLKNEHFSLQNELWREIREQIFNGSKTRNFSFNIIWKVAACVAIILSSYFVITSEKTFVTNDNILAVTLPDGSTVDMEPYSELKFNRIKWLFKRDMQFTGEGKIGRAHV